MPRRRAPPRLYLDPARKTWIIRDGKNYVRTGCGERERADADKQLAAYITNKHQPEGGPDPLIADVLTVYATEHAAYAKNRKNIGYAIGVLTEWWGTKRVSEIGAATCRAYAATRTPAYARLTLETLRAAVRHWQREKDKSLVVPTFTLPETPEARDRWLTREEVARLLWAGRRCQYLRRFILIGIYTGTRSDAILGLRWSQVDLKAGRMSRRAPGKAEDKRKRTPPVRLGRRILAHLRRWRRLDGPGDWHLCHYDGQRIKKMRRPWHKARAAAGLGPDVLPHVLRHTRATWLMQAGVPIWEAAGHLGMTPEILTNVYGKHSPDWQERAAEV